MYRSRLYFALVLSLYVSCTYAVGTGVCTGYPLMYNGKHCASTTRYWDGNTGACGCGTGNTDPFSWQYTTYTAAGSPPIFGSGTWCGSGCGSCYELTPTAVGASPIPSLGAPNLNSIVIKVTNLCPPDGNANWCSYDINEYGYDAHFDLMDYNMNGLITALGWDNPEVTYQQVDCATSNLTQWSCQCAADTTLSSTTTATAAPTSTPTSAPTSAPTQAPTSAPTTAPTGGPITIQVSSGTNQWWVGISLTNAADVSSVAMKDSGAATSGVFQTMSYAGNQYYNLYSFGNGMQLTAPLSLRLTATNGEVVELDSIIGSLEAGVSYNSGTSM